MVSKAWRMARIPLVLALALAVGCSGEVYLRDGVTDGDTFYLADRALSDPDPVLQSWVRYSLARSTCQLEIGGDNPARATSFECELKARGHLLEAWAEYRRADSALADSYLDSLSGVEDAGFLSEYIVHYHGRRSWRLSGELDAAGFRDWRRRNLRGHEAETRLIGSWNYARNVRP
jgi:hypothetical protein